MRICIFDLEADGYLHNVTKVHCGSFKDINTQEIWKFKPHQIKEMLEFMDTCTVLIGHNIIGYDFPVLKKLYNYEFKGSKVDTLIMSRLLDTRRISPPHCPNKKAPHSIEAWGYRVGVHKIDWRAKAIELGLIDEDAPDGAEFLTYHPEMLVYNTRDIIVNELVYHALLKEAKGENWRNAFLLSFKLFENLQRQEEYGWLVDREYMEWCIRQLDRWIERIDRVITPKLPLVLEIEEGKENGEVKYIKKPFLVSGKYSKPIEDWYDRTGISRRDVPVVGCFSRVSFRPTNLNSNEETKDFLLSLGWEPLEWNTNDFGERTSAKLSKDDPFEGIDGKLGKLVAKRVQCRQRKSIIEGLLGLIRDDGRIGSAVNTLAATGRCTHRNIVNIPRVGSFYGKQLRKMFICKEGYVLVGTDSDGNQIRQLCARMGDPVYQENVLNGKREDGTDIHSVNMRAAGLDSRDNAKTFFYGFIFGAGDSKVGKIVKGTAAHGRALKEKFLTGLPALGKLIEKLTEEWKSTAKKRYNAKFNRMEYYDGYVTGLDGRPILIPYEHQILVYVLQSDEAIQMSAAYNKFHKDMDARGYVYGEDYGVVCFYHDEFTVECRKDIAEEVKQLSEEAIAWAGRYYNISCPHQGNGNIGLSWYAIH